MLAVAEDCPLQEVREEDFEMPSDDAFDDRLHAGPSWGGRTPRLADSGPAGQARACVRDFDDRGPPRRVAQAKPH